MTEKVWKWYNSLSNRIRDSIVASVTLNGLIATVMSIVGVTLNDLTQSIWISILIIIGMLVVVAAVGYWSLGQLFKEFVSFTIRNTPTYIVCGDIFEVAGLKVIGCDTHFDTRVDDVVISKNSLHGKLVLKHGKADDIKAVVEQEAQKRCLTKNTDDLYDFELGTIIRYDSTVDNQTYLMLAMTELDENYEAHTNMAKFEQMLMRMWSEIDRIYASNDVVLPLLGTGISRFDDGPKDKNALLKCMLCTLNSSGVSLNSNVKVVIYGDPKDIPLYEYKDMLKGMR